MKKILSTIVALTIAAGVTAQAQTNVASQNAVGYVKIDIEPGAFTLATMPFFEVGDSSPQPITDAIGDQLTGTGGFVFGSDNIIIFDQVSQTYVSHWKSTSDDTWRDTSDLLNATTNTLSPGQSFFVLNNQATNQSLYLMGEVPDSSTAATSTVVLIDGFTLAGYSYPVDIAITNLNLEAIANPGVFGDSLIVWDTENQKFDSYVYDNVGFGGPSTIGWKLATNPTGSATTNVLKAGQGFFYSRSAGVTNWVSSKPYTYP